MRQASRRDPLVVTWAVNNPIGFSTNVLVKVDMFQKNQNILSYGFHSKRIFFHTNALKLHAFNYIRTLWGLQFNKLNTFKFWSVSQEAVCWLTNLQSSSFSCTADWTRTMTSWRLILNAYISTKKTTLTYLLTSQSSKPTVRWGTFSLSYTSLLQSFKNALRTKI